MLSEGREEGPPGALEAWGGLSGSRSEADEEARHRSPGGAWEEAALSYLEARGDPWGVRTGLWEACPWEGEGACRGAAAPVGLIRAEQEGGAPCREERVGASASEAFRGAYCLGTVVVQVGVRPAGPLREACPCWGACWEAWIQEEEQAGRQKAAACLASPWLPAW